MSNAIKGAGCVIGPALSGFIINAKGFAMIFVVAAAVGSAALLLSLLLPSDTAKSAKIDDDDDELPFREFILIFKEPRLLPIYAVIVINMFLVGILFGFLPVYVNSLGYDQLHNGLIIGACTLSYLLIQPFAGRLADRINPVRVVLAGLIFSAAGLFPIPLPFAPPLTALASCAGTPFVTL